MSGKVDCYPEELPDARWSGRRWGIQAKRVLPFCASPVGTRMHRCRTAVILEPLVDEAGVVLRPARLSPSAWCGVSATHFMLYADPGEMEVCGTCEGRAIGAGQIPAPPGYDFDLLFSPRLPVARCTWEKRRQGYGYVDYGVCGGRGFAVATLGDVAHVVCRNHRRSAIVKGWHVTEGVPLDAHRS